MLAIFNLGAMELVILGGLFTAGVVVVLLVVLATRSKGGGPGGE